MNQQTWTKVGNVLGYLIIQSTFGIIYFTFDVCKKVEKVEEQGHPNNNLTCTKDQTAYIYENNNSDKFSSSLEGFHLSLHPLSTLDISMCAKLQNSSTQKFENSVLFSKLEDVEWVRTCMISAMGVVAFLVSIKIQLKAWLRGVTREVIPNLIVPKFNFLLHVIFLRFEVANFFVVLLADRDKSS